MPILKYLADTDAISDSGRVPTVTHWFAQHRHQIAISTFALAEMGRGVELKAKKGGNWLNLQRKLGFVLQDFQGAILPFEQAEASEWGRMMALWEKALPPLGDSYIAAVGLAHELTVVTGNVDHFRPVRRINPHDGSEYPPDQAPA